MSLTAEDPRLLGIEEILNRIASDVSIVADVPIRVEGVQAEVVGTKPAGAGVVHIAFRLDFHEDGERRQGCVLVPLPDAQVLAGGLLMQPTTRLDEARGRDDLDRTTKEAVMELGTFLAGATESALRDAGHVLVQVHHRGCQGVRADVAPRLDGYTGGPLVAGTCEAKVGDYDPGTWHVVLPELDCLRTAAD